MSRLVRGIRTLGARPTLAAALYPLRKAYYLGKFARTRGLEGQRGSRVQGALSVLSRPTTPPAQASPYAFPGRVLAHVWKAPGETQPIPLLELTCEYAMVRIALLAADLVRVRVSPTGRLDPPDSYAIAKPDREWPAVHAELEQTADRLVVRTDRLACHIARAHFSVDFLDPDGTVIQADAAGVGWERESERVLCWKRMPPGEHVYGLGQKTSALDKRGQAFDMWNRDPLTYDPGDDPIYASIPFYIGLVDGRAYGVFLDNPARSCFDFGLHTPGITRFEADCGELRYYFAYGPRMETVLERYTELTGRAPLPPLWALGYHQSRWSYAPEARVRQVAEAFRQRQIPCEAIHLDIDYMDGFRCFTWDRQRFPDPAQLVADLHAQGFKVVAVVDPGIKADPNYAVCRDGLERGAFCRYPDGRPYSGPVWPGECYFPDYTSPDVRAWWGSLYRDMVEMGIDGFWNDMNEPTVFGPEGDTFPDIVRHDWEGQGADHRLAHNVYGLQMARATFEGLSRLRPGARPLVITRSLWAGAQRCAMHWLGDNRSDWDSLRNVLPLTLNMGLSGVPFTGPDTGGFHGSPDGELMIRWNQLGAFTPFFRNHTAKHTADQEPWAFGETCEQICREFIALRYRLLPYHYTAFWQATQRGLPVMRPLVLAFQEDAHAAAMDDAFMYGDALYVAPVTEPGVTSRRAYIPMGLWYDYWTDVLTGGPQIARLEAPISRIPVLVRAGSVIPAWPVMQHTGERPIDCLTLHVYPGNGTSWLYEDDGHSFAFESGQYRQTRFDSTLRQDSAGSGRRQLRVQASADGSYVPDYARVQVVLHGAGAGHQRATVDGVELHAAQPAQNGVLSFECEGFRAFEILLERSNAP